ncbi:MAG TPA: hypothetical protein VI488_08665 [Candidatus Angelobacter sp.]
MKKLATFVFAMLLAGSLSFAQTGTGTPATSPATKTDTTKTGKKGAKTSKAHKGGKKSKKGAGTSTTNPPPK